MKKFFKILLILTALTNIVHAEDLIMHTNFQIYPNSEFFPSEDFNIKQKMQIKNIKVKQVTITKDTRIKNGEIIEGEPNYVVVTLEITDKKGNKSEVSSGKDLYLGDYKYIIHEEQIK